MTPRGGSQTRNDGHKGLSSYLDRRTAACAEQERDPAAIVANRAFEYLDLRSMVDLRWSCHACSMAAHVESMSVSVDARAAWACA